MSIKYCYFEQVTKRPSEAPPGFAELEKLVRSDRIAALTGSGIHLSTESSNQASCKDRILALTCGGEL